MATQSTQGLINPSQYGSSDSPLSDRSDGFGYNNRIVPEQKNKYRKYKIFFFIALVVIGILVIAFSAVELKESEKPFLTILQMNDVYEIGPVAGLGGFARLATYHQQLTKSEKNLITVMAGDFYSPSALGVAPVQLTPDEPEKPLHGRHMVDVMNRLGSKKDDFFVTFGNHEYDVGEESFYARIAESNFTYISTNVDPGPGHVWPDHVVPFYFKNVDDKVIAFLSLSILVETNLPYINQFSFSDSVQKLKNTIDMFAKKGLKYDLLICITHQSLADDSAIAMNVPEIDIIMGGHEHENWKINRSLNPRHPIYVNKADSNAKTVFVHRFYWHKDVLNTPAAKNTTEYGRAAQIPGLLTIDSTLVPIDSKIEPNKEMDLVVQRWTTLGFEAFVKKGLDPGRVMCHLTDFINALDKTTRGTVSIMGAFLVDAFLYSAQKDYQIPSDDNRFPYLIPVANIGAVRIDDYLLVGDLYEYDALRILPFGGFVDILEITGKALKRMLVNVRGQLGTGMWMGYNPEHITCPDSPLMPTIDCKWTVYDTEIQDDMIYTLVIPDYIHTKDPLSWFDSVDDFKFIKRTSTDQQHSLIDHFGRVYPVQ